MKHYFYLLASTFFLLSCEETITEDEKSFATVFEKSTGNTTATYSEVIDYYLQLAKTFPEINVQTIGETDSGNPLHLVTYNPDGNFNCNSILSISGRSAVSIVLSINVCVLSAVNTILLITSIDNFLSVLS